MRFFIDVYIPGLYNDQVLKDKEISSIDDVLSESKVIYGPLLWSQRPYGQPGPLPMIGSSGLLIELKAQFYKLVTL